jgi:cytochrome d ubiquinol oxidase subunit I
VVYLAVFGAGTAYMLRLIREGPHVDEGRVAKPGGPGRHRQPMRPISAAESAAEPADEPPQQKG